MLQNPSTPMTEMSLFCIRRAVSEGHRGGGPGFKPGRPGEKLTSRRQHLWLKLDQNLLAAVFLLAATLLIWLPAIHPYVPLADDYGYSSRLSTDGSWGFLKSYFREEGVWRVVGHFVTTHLATTGGLLPHLAFLLVHWGSGFILYLLLNRLLSDRWLSILWALIFLSSPFGIEAGLWASAMTYVLSFFLFMVLLLTLYVIQPRGAMSLNLGISIVACTALLTLLCNEALLFPVILSGIPLAFQYGPKWRLRWRGYRGRALTGIIPAAAALVFLVLHSFLGASSRMPKIRIRSIFSSVLYQSYGAKMMKVLWTPDTYHLPIFQLSNLHYLSILLLAVALLAAGSVIRSDSDLGKNRDISVWVPVWIAIGLFSCGSIYALAGGYSPDSRKKYAFVAFFVALGATLLSHLSSRAALRSTLAFTVVLFAATVWIWCGIWNLAADRDRVIEQALDSVRQSGRAFLVTLQSTPRLDVPWAENVLTPRLEVFWDPMWNYQQRSERGNIEIGVKLVAGDKWKITSIVSDASRP